VWRYLEFSMNLELETKHVTSRAAMVDGMETVGQKPINCKSAVLINAIYSKLRNQLPLIRSRISLVLPILAGQL
jgi:hypothetical protein